MIVAGVSAAIALVALVVSILVARRQTAIQERVAAIEEARRAEEVEARTRARVTASIVYGDARPAMSAVTYPPLDRWLMLATKGRRSPTASHWSRSKGRGSRRSAISRCYLSTCSRASK